MSEEYKPITPDDIKTDDYGRVLDTELRVYQIINNKHIEKIPIRVDGEDVLLLEGDWRHVCQLYRKVEQPEQREPREVWIPVHSDFGFRIDERFYQNVTECCESAKDCNPRLFREVLPPEVKELPDSVGVWWFYGEQLPIAIEGEPGALVFWHESDRLFKDVSQLPSGKWIKIENPHGREV